MDSKPFVFIEYICEKCGADICATDFFVGKLKPCKHCGHAMVVPSVSWKRPPGDDHAKQRVHEPPRNLRDERFYATILGVQPGADREDIKRAYKGQLMRYHPDRVEHLGREFQEMADQKTKLINEAYCYYRNKLGQ